MMPHLKWGLVGALGCNKTKQKWRTAEAPVRFASAHHPHPCATHKMQPPLKKPKLDPWGRAAGVAAVARPAASRITVKKAGHGTYRHLGRPRLDLKSGMKAFSTVIKHGRTRWSHFVPHLMCRIPSIITFTIFANWECIFLNRSSRLFVVACFFALSIANITSSQATDR